MSPDMLALLDEADACHDDDPPRAAELLRRVEPVALPAERLRGLAFMLNHVLGEKLGAWGEAHARFEALLGAAGPTAPPVLCRQAAAAARLAGDEPAAARLSAALASGAGTSAALAEDAVALTAAMYRAPTLPDADLAAALSASLQALDAAHWQAPTPLDAAAAASLNNIASSLVERPPVGLRQPPLRGLAEDCARRAEAFWLRAGTWVQHERAAYLRAMVGNALGDPAAARGHALRALALLDVNDTAQAESVDRAFIELERARACRDLALGDEAQVAQAAADALAARFDDAGLDAWFAKRRAELEAPAAPVG